MLTPKSLLTWMMAIFFRPWSSAYFAAAVPCSASEVMVRKNMPLVLPSRPRLVSVGEDEAGETCTTCAGAGHRGQDRDRDRGDDAADDRPGPSSSWTSWFAASTASVPWLCASRVSATSLQPCGAAGVVQIAERHLDRLGAGLAIFAGRAGQFHHDADRDRRSRRAPAQRRTSASSDARPSSARVSF